MAEKIPSEFVPGDIIEGRKLAYSGSPVKVVEGLGMEQTQVTFENGEVVVFANGYTHQTKE